MNNLLHAWFAAVPLENPLERRQAPILRSILLGTLIVTLLGIPLALSAPGSSIGHLITFTSTMLLLPFVASALLLLRRGQFKLATIAAIIGIIIPETVIMFNAGLFQSGSLLAGFVIPVTLAGLLLGRRALVAVVSVSVLIIAGAAIREQIIPKLYDPAQHSLRALILAGSFMLVIGLFGLLLDRFGSSLHEALRAALAREHDLEALKDSLELTVAERTAALQDALRLVEEREVRYRTLSELTSDYIYALNVGADGQVTIDWMTDAAARVTGYTAVELLQPTIWHRLIHPDDADLYQERIRLLYAGCIDTREYRIRTKTGETRWVLDYGRPERDAAGQIIRLLGAAQDITERKQVEIALRTSEHRQKTILNTIPDVVWLKDTTGHYLLVNSAYAQLYQRIPADILGQTISELAPPHIAERLHAEDEEIIQTGHTRRYEIPFIDRAGVTRWFETIKQPVYDPQGVVLGTSGIARDITEHKQLVHDLQNALATVKTLSGLLPICASCKKIRDERSEWQPLERYIHTHSEATFTHSICPDCARLLYGDLDSA